MKQVKQKTAERIDGKILADKVLLDVKSRIAKMENPPGLAAILIGDDPASKLYIKNKEKACHKVGMEFHKYLCNQECYPFISQKEAIAMIDFLNRDPQISGIIVQLPLPEKFDTEKIIAAIDPQKDADGFHPANYKKYLAGDDEHTPPLIKAILKIIREYDITLKDKHVVVISDSKIFSKGLTYALKKRGAKTNVVSSTSKTLKNVTQKGDVIISIVGKPHFLKASLIKDDAVLIDVGITLTPSGFQGDVDQKSVQKKASMLTPTPGGVGPLTVAMLLENTYLLANKK